MQHRTLWTTRPLRTCVLSGCLTMLSNCLVVYKTLLDNAVEPTLSVVTDGRKRLLLLTLTNSLRNRKTLIPRCNFVSGILDAVQALYLNGNGIASSRHLPVLQ